MINPHHVKNKMTSFDHPLDVDPMLVMSRGVHRSEVISAVIIHEING